MELTIENMTCSGCARAVTKAIQSVDLAAQVEADPAARTVRIETTSSQAALRLALEQVGYPATAI